MRLLGVGVMELLVRNLSASGGGWREAWMWLWLWSLGAAGLYISEKGGGGLGILR